MSEIQEPSKQEDTSQNTGGGEGGACGAGQQPQWDVSNLFGNSQDDPGVNNQTTGEGDGDGHDFTHTTGPGDLSSSLWSSTTLQEIRGLNVGAGGYQSALSRGGTLSNLDSNSLNFGQNGNDAFVMNYDFYGANNGSRNGGNGQDLNLGNSWNSTLGINPAGQNLDLNLGLNNNPFDLNKPNDPNNPFGDKTLAQLLDQQPLPPIGALPTLTDSLLTATDPMGFAMVDQNFDGVADWITHTADQMAAQYNSENDLSPTAVKSQIESFGSALMSSIQSGRVPPGASGALNDLYGRASAIENPQMRMSMLSDVAAMMAQVSTAEKASAAVQDLPAMGMTSQAAIAQMVSADTVRYMSNRNQSERKLDVAV